VYNRILVPVDRSAFAENALPRAVAIARRSGGTIHLVTVHAAFWPEATRPASIGVDAGFDAVLVREEQEYVEALARSVGADHGVATMSALLDGPVASAIARYSRENGIDLIVMSTHGHGGFRRTWLGSTADRLLRRLRVPVLLIRPVDSVTPVRAHGEFHDVLVALDGDTAAERALEAAAELPFAEGARCTLLRVAQVPILPGSSYIPDTARDNRAQLEERTREAGEYLAEIAVEASRSWDVVHQHVIAAHRTADTILDEADGTGADLIVVGTHARGHLGRAVLGSVADKVIRGATVPVLVFPARAVKPTRSWSATTRSAPAHTR
jgi:nucleotide-binding universal stress UspA family protein